MSKHRPFTNEDLAKLIANPPRYYRDALVSLALIILNERQARENAETALRQLNVQFDRICAQTKISSVNGSPPEDDPALLHGVIKDLRDEVASLQQTCQQLTTRLATHEKP